MMDSSYKLYNKQEQKERKRILFKLKRRKDKSMFTEAIIAEIITPVLVLALIYVSYLSSILTEVESPVMKAVVGILVLSVAFYNVARGVKKLRESKKDERHDTDERS